MNLHRRSWLAPMLVAMAPCLAAPAFGQAFDLVSQTRFISGRTEAVIFGLDGVPGTGIDSFRVDAPDSGPFQASRSITLDVAAPDGSASAQQSASAHQNSFITSESIRLEASVGTHTAGLPLPPGSFSSAFSQSFAEFVFDVHTPQPVRLVGESFTNFQLTLSRDDAVLWHGSPGQAPQTGPFITFAASLLLTPGRYNLTADFNAASGDSVVGEFQITVVPEPGSWLLMILGIAVIGMAVTRSRRAAV